MRSPPPLGRPTLIVAVDGVLADSLPLRLEALGQAMRTVGLLEEPQAARSHATIAGRSWREAARMLAGPDADETLLDLAALAAERALQARLAREPWTWSPEAIRRCHEAVAQGWRVLLRADTTRRAAGPLLDFLMTETGAARCIAGDDMPVSVDRDPLLERQYRALNATADEQSKLLAHESTANAADRAVAVIPDLELGWPTNHPGA